MVPGFARARERVGPVPVAIKLYQGVGALPGSHKDFAFNVCLLLFYSQVLGLPATWVSIALAIALVADAVTDPLVGSFSDSFRSRLGRRHPLMYVAALPLGMAMYALFSPPASVAASSGALLAWLLAATLAVRLIFTFFVVPWNALASEYSTDYEERTSIITYRYLVGWIGGATFALLMYSFIFPPTEEQTNGLLVRENYATFALVIASLMSLWALITTHMTRSQVAFLPQPAGPPARFRFGTALHEVRLALANDNFRRLFLAVLLFAAIDGVGKTFDPYMNIFFWEFTTDDLRFFSATIIGAFLAFGAVPLLQVRYQKQTILVATLSAVMINGMLRVIFRFIEVWPPNQDPLLLPMLIAHSAVQVFLLTAAGIMFASMIADIVDEQEARVNLRQEGVFSSALGFSAKATSSVGLIAGGLLLDHVIGFPLEAQPGAVAQETLVRLAIVDGILLHLLFFVPIALLLRYDLTRSRLRLIQADLRARAQRDEARD